MSNSRRAPTQRQRVRIKKTGELGELMELRWGHVWVRPLGGGTETRLPSDEVEPVSAE